MAATITIPLSSDVVEGITFLIVDILLRSLVAKSINVFSEVQHSKEMSNTGKIELSLDGVNMFVDRPTTYRGKVVQTVCKVITLIAISAVSFTTLGRTEDSREVAEVVRSIQRQDVIQYSSIIDRMVLHDFETFDNEVMWAKLMTECSRRTFGVTQYEEVVCSKAHCIDVFLKENVYSGDAFEDELTKLRRQAECRVDLEDANAYEEITDLTLRGEAVFGFENARDGWEEKHETSRENLSMVVYSQLLEENGFEIECNVLQRKIDRRSDMIMRCVGDKLNSDGTVDMFRYQGTSAESLRDAQIADYKWDNGESVSKITRVNAVDRKDLSVVKDSILLLGMGIDVALRYSKYQPAKESVRIKKGSINVTDLQVWSIVMLAAVGCFWLIMLMVYSWERGRAGPISSLATWQQWMGTVNNAMGNADCRFLSARSTIYGKKKYYKHIGPLTHDEMVGAYDIMEARGLEEWMRRLPSRNDLEPDNEVGKDPDYFKV